MAQNSHYTYGTCARDEGSAFSPLENFPLASKVK